MAATEVEPRVVLCFGDSNTYGAHGHIDKQGIRLPYAKRWTTLLQETLGNGTIVIPEGLNGRTSVMDDPHNWINDGRADTGASANGRRYLMPCLYSHKPISVVVLALGCNDLKTRFALSPSEIAKGCRLLVEDIRASGCGPGGGTPAIVLMSVPALRLVDHHPDFGPERVARSLATIKAYEDLANDAGIKFVSLEGIATSEDGLHYDEGSSALVAEAVAAQVALALNIDLLRMLGLKKLKEFADRLRSDLGALTSIEHKNKKFTAVKEKMIEVISSGSCPFPGCSLADVNPVLDKIKSEIPRLPMCPRGPPPAHLVAASKGSGKGGLEPGVPSSPAPTTLPDGLSSPQRAYLSSLRQSAVDLAHSAGIHDPRSTEPQQPRDAYAAGRRRRSIGVLEPGSKKHRNN